VKIDIAVSKKIDAEKKKGADKSGIGIKILGTARSLFIVGNKISSCRLLDTTPSATYIIGMIGQISSSRTMIDVLMSRSGGVCQFMIGWGAGLVCKTGLVNVLVIFQVTRRNLKKWQMHGFLMNLYYAEMLILTG